MTEPRRRAARRHRAPQEPSSGGLSPRAGAGIAIAAIAVFALAGLRHAAPGPEQVAQQVTGPRPVRLVPSPSAPPRGPLPSPVIVDPAQNQVVGYVPIAGGKPGKETALIEVDTILDWYCPQSSRRSSELRPSDGWRSAEVTTYPHPGMEITLHLRWTGSSYRWHGAYDQLDACW